MEQKRLTPDLLDEFMDYLKNINASINILDDFLFNLSTLIDLNENKYSSKRMEKINKTANLGSIEELNQFFGKYFEYTNSIVSFFVHLEKIRSVDTIEELLNELFLKFSSYYDNAYRIIMPIIQSNGENLVDIVMKKYLIDYNSDYDDLKESISQKLGEPHSLFMSSLILLLEEAKRDKDSHDQNLSGILFRMLIIFVMKMNLLRKVNHLEAEVIRKEYLLAEKIKKENPHINRNSPCPCGSGLKFKKCCLLRLK